MKNLFIFFFIVLVQPIYAQENSTAFQPICAPVNCPYVVKHVTKYFDVPEKFLDYTPLLEKFHEFTKMGAVRKNIYFSYSFFIIKEITPQEFIETVQRRSSLYEGFSITDLNDDMVFYSIQIGECEDCEESEEGRKLLEFLKMSNKYIKFEDHWYPVLFGEYDLDFFLAQNTNTKQLEYYYEKFNMTNNYFRSTVLLVQRPRFTKIELKKKN